MVRRWQSVVLVAVGLVLLGTGIGAALDNPSSDDYQIAIKEERSVNEFSSFPPTDQETLLTVFNRTHFNGTTTVPREQLPPPFRSDQRVTDNESETPKQTTPTHRLTPSAYEPLNQVEFVLNHDGTLLSLTTTPQPDTQRDGDYEEDPDNILSRGAIFVHL